MIPPCVKDTRTDSAPSTVAVKFSAPNSAAVQWAAASTIPGVEARITALVQLQTDLEASTGVLYLVLTPTKLSTFQNYKMHIVRKLELLAATVEWVRPFDRRLQRLFQWGDSWLDDSALQKAVDDGDACTLTMCFPALKHAIELGGDYIEHLPALRAGSLLCIADQQPQDTKKKLYLEHEQNLAHDFGEPSKNWECTICNELAAARCACGAQRCSRHQKPPEPENKVAWKQNSPDAKLFVHDPKHMPKELKIDWLRDELDADASLDKFAQVYLKLFADKMCVEKQRVACLELYGMFNSNFKAKKECELEPARLESFQKVFDSKATSRCRWCNSQSTELYCSQACLNAAHPPEQCIKCGSEGKLSFIPDPSKGVLAGIARCANCKHFESCRVAPASSGTKRSGGSHPQHWTKRRRA